MSSGMSDSLQAISVKLVGDNYVYWAYVMKNFLLGKNVWDVVTGDSPMPTDANVEKFQDLLCTWQVTNAKIITWINNSVDQSIGIHFAKFTTAKQIWDHLSRLYIQSNFAKRYQLEHEICATQQGDKSIQEFYFTMTGLWDQLAFTEPKSLGTHAAYCTYREVQRLVQFLMALRADFEGLRGTILHRSPLPSVDSVVNELLAEELRFKTALCKGLFPLPTQTVLAVPTGHSSTTPSKSYARAPMDECSFCHKKGHWKAQRPWLLSRPPFGQSPTWRKNSDRHFGQSSSWKKGHTAATTSLVDDSSPSLTVFAEQLQKLLSTHTPNALAVSSPLGLSSSPSSPPGSSFQAADWDRP